MFERRTARGLAVLARGGDFRDANRYVVSHSVRFYEYRKFLV